MDKELEVKVVNRLNFVTNETAKFLLDFFRPLVGKMVARHDGTVRWEHHLEIPPFEGVNIWQDTFVNCLLFRVVAFVVEDNNIECAENSIFIGDVQNKILLNLAEYKPKKDDYTLEEVEELRKQLKEAEKNYQNALDALENFTH